MKNSPVPKVDLCFQVLGCRIAVDHGFALYSAISRILPKFHEDEHSGLKLIRGRYCGNGYLDISPYSELVMRMPYDVISLYMALAGKTLEILGDKLYIGIPNTRALTPAAELYATLVTTKNGHEQTRFTKEITARLQDMEIDSAFRILKRRTIKIHGKQVVGYSLIVRDLTERQSITLQEQGLGGRRKMGCGFLERWENGKV